MFIITDACTNCGDCVSECAVDAISAGDTQHTIDPDACAECGARVSACPNEAIIEE
ncbi:MAG: 4Fe-4S binding protein [Gracilibacteraceae bacterium]|nr:4Fe-4S binding protein [Gracilibacteraceae bacterium]